MNNSLYNLSGKENPLYKERIKKYCLVCGNEFEVIQSREKHYPAKYCSMKCWGKVLSIIKTKEKTKHICQYCNKEFKTIKSIKRKYCSRECCCKASVKRINGKHKSYCVICNKEFESITKKSKVCSKECKNKLQSNTILNKYNITNAGEMSVLRHNIRALYYFRLWLSDCLTRDNFMCQKCGRKKQLHVHHIKTFGSIIKKYNIKNSKEAKECAELWDINNGMTLCKKCHKRLRMSKTKNEGLQLNINYN